MTRPNKRGHTRGVFGNCGSLGLQLYVLTKLVAAFHTHSAVEKLQDESY
jgi:hypothetical protein